jgi:hypothetical protein
MRHGVRVLGALTAAVLGLAVVVLAGPSASSEPNTWYYEDKPDSPRGPINVEHTELDITASKFRVRVYGREFIKNRTDLVAIYFDTSRSNHGPEYRYQAIIGKLPNGRRSGQVLGRLDSWELSGKSVQCGGMKVKTNFAQDVIAITMPKRCLGKPDEIRWAGYVGEVSRIGNNSYYGSWDDFPAERTLPRFWAS